MTTEEFIIQLFCCVDDVMGDVPKHRQAKLYPSELVTIRFLFVLKGSPFRAFYRWLARDYGVLFGRIARANAVATFAEWASSVV